MRDKALVKKTEEVLDIDSIFKQVTMSINYPIELGISPEEANKKRKKDMLFSILYKKGDLKTGCGFYYFLSDGKSYKESDIVIGIENIREYKLKKLL